jgi:hypothetical protein
MKFYLGIWQPNHARKVDKFFFSFRRLQGRRIPLCENGQDWIMDSGGFSELRQNGHYTFGVHEYLGAVELHRPVAFAVMDWMCEPVMLERTGLTIREHQERTVESWLEIQSLWDGESEIMPVVQGWTPEEYRECIQMYLGAGAPPDGYFGIGSVCTRQGLPVINAVLSAVRAEIPHARLHGFGVKMSLLQTWGRELLYSADSMAWSYAGRKRRRHLPECKSQAKNCANCLPFALYWRRKVEAILDKPYQMHLSQEIQS